MDTNTNFTYREVKEECNSLFWFEFYNMIFIQKSSVGSKEYLVWSKSDHEEQQNDTQKESH